MTDPNRPTAANYAEVHGHTFQGTGEPWRRDIVFQPKHVPDGNRIVDSRSPVTVTPGPRGYFTVLLWPGRWEAVLADGRRIPFTVEAGTRNNLADLRSEADK